MPRLTTLDVPGLLQHVLTRGIEGTGVLLEKGCFKGAALSYRVAVCSEVQAETR